MKQNCSIMWFRRDLRLFDNHALSQALSSKHAVLPIFIFDDDILESLPKDDHRVNYIHHALSDINDRLNTNNHSLAVFHGKPIEIFKKLLRKYHIDAVYVNHDYEPYAQARDREITQLLNKHAIEFHSFKDQVIFEKKEVIKDDASPYVVYTPYMKRWKANFQPSADLKEYICETSNYLKHTEPFLSLKDIGFTASDIPMPDPCLDQELLDGYAEKRDFPALSGTSHIGTALRFGTLSIRKVMKQAIAARNETFMNELIWREFFMQILWHYPHTATQAFKEKYDTIPWRDAPEDLQKWKDGQTGFPLVDAGMRELNTTGYMHNRVRMVVASFLCKHLLIDWRLGEGYFAKKLFDYEMSSNVGNWQWAAGSGVDAAPYFRIFNPETQMKKFDPKGEYVRTWVPEYFEIGYVSPMLDHKEARERAIETYKTALDAFRSDS